MLGAHYAVSHVPLLVVIWLAAPAQIKTQSASCVDKDPMTMTVEVGVSGEKQNYSCPDLIQAWPHFCDPGVKGTVRIDCCKSCTGVDYSCVDRNVALSWEVRGQPLKVTCSDLGVVEKAVNLCFDESVKTVCCKTCSQHKCVDNPNKYWRLKQRGEDKLSCEELVKEDECFCAKSRIRRNCCSSCEHANYEKKECDIYKTNESDKDDDAEKESDAKDTCKDTEGHLHLLNVAGSTLELTCADLQQESHVCYCAFAQKDCCESCAGVDLSVSRDCVVGVDVRGVVFTQCGPLLDFYPWFCNDVKYSAEGGLCQSACAEPERVKSAQCSDHPSQTFKIKGQVYYCDGVVSLNKNYCKDDRVLKPCCGSCAKEGLDGSAVKISEPTGEGDTTPEPTGEGDTTPEPTDEEAQEAETAASGEPPAPARAKALQDTPSPLETPEPTEASAETPTEAPAETPTKAPAETPAEAPAETPVPPKETPAPTTEEPEPKCADSSEPFSVDGLKTSTKPAKLTCKEMVKILPQLCLDNPGPGLTSYKDTCCVSCQKADTSVTDSLDFTASVCSPNGKHLCEECRCYELHRTNKKIAEKACCRVKGTLESCPLICKKFPVCVHKVKKKIKANHVAGLDQKCVDSVEGGSQKNKKKKKNQVDKKKRKKKKKNKKSQKNKKKKKDKKKKDKKKKKKTKKDKKKKKKKNNKKEKKKRKNKKKDKKKTKDKKV